MNTNIHTHLFSADHTAPAQLYFLLRGALHSAARSYYTFVSDNGAAVSTEDLRKFDHALDRFGPPWPTVFNLAINASRIAGGIGLIRPTRLIDMFCTVARVTREEVRAIFRLNEHEEEAAFLDGLIRRTDAAKQAHSPLPFRDALCAVVSELFAKHEANVKTLGRVTQREVWNTFMNSAGADQYTRVVALSVNMDKAFTMETLPKVGNRPALPFKTQAQELEALAAEVNAAGGVQILPFLGVEPRGFDTELLDYVRERVGAGKAWKGIKLYPSMGFHPTDERLMPVFDFCQEQSIPVLAHCSHGGAGVHGSDRNFTDYSGPTEWEPVLARLAQRDSGEFRLCLAHFDNLESPLNSPYDDSWSNSIVHQMMTYDGSNRVKLFTDIAFDVISGARDRETYTKNVQKVKELGLSNRVLFGSDWWMYLYECSDEQRFIEQLNVDGGWWNESDFEQAANAFLGDL